MAHGRLFALFAAAAMLCGCASDVGLAPEKPMTGAFVVGDEPYAVKAATSVLAQGGNAADAAAAMYFALAVTYPVAAGLGGGGICLVHRPAKGREEGGRNEEFDFLARSTASGGAFAVPGNVRGFAALQTNFGALPWQRVVSQAEGFASTGFAISGALAARLASAEDVIRLDAGLASEFMDESGHVKQAGSIVTNRELADTLTAIRTGGADAFYRGANGQRIAAYSIAQGGTVTLEELGAYKVGRVLPHVIRLGDGYVFMPGESTGAGMFAGALFDGLSRNHSGNTEAATVAAAKQALARFAVSGLPNDLGSTGFAATDDSGLAVACAVTMNGPFGSGHTAQGSGVTLARAPSSSTAGLAAAFLTPVLATDNDGHLLLAGAGAGGPIGTASMADAIARLSKAEIVTRGNKTAVGDAPRYDTVNAILCQTGGCTALSDASANGLGAAPSF